MLKKNFNIHLFLSIVFLLTTVFPPSLFSYQESPYGTGYSSDSGWVDESLDYRPVTYKKVRCSRCGMEFYYVPGKECPHSHWIHYEIPREDLSEDSTSDFEKETQYNTELDKDKKKGALSNLLRQKKEGDDKITRKIKRRLHKREGENRDFSIFESEDSKSKQERRYELRQKLTCPYDGHEFFPEGDLVEDVKLLQKDPPIEQPSAIESSFTRSIPFGVSKELKQFGYDLFKIFGDSSRKEKEQSIATGEAGGALTTLGILKDALSPGRGSEGVKIGSNIAVVAVEPDYIIGPGDTMVVNIWGSVQQNFPIEVDGEGKIMLPKAGPLYVWGLRFKDAETKIREQLDKYFANLEIGVSMGKLRNVKVYILGEVKKPGFYSMKSRSTIFQALYAAGGPTKMGSLRKIKLIQADGREQTIDAYSFLLGGSRKEYFQIQSGDTIFVPPVGDVVAIAGNVKRPAIYETKSKIPLSDLLSFAGGMMPTADFQHIQIERVRNNERRVMLDIELEPSELGGFSLDGIDLQNGDMVIVSPIVRLKHDFVSILGNVERPGDYALTKDMKVDDLIKMAKGFLPGTYLSRAEISRVTKDRTRQTIPVNLDKLRTGVKEENILLNEWDILFIYSHAEVNPPSFVEIDGAVNKPGKYELTPAMKVSDLIFKAGGVRPGDVIEEAELFHIMPGESPVIRKIAVKRLFDAKVSVDKDIILRAGDTLFVKSEPKLTERRTVVIEGEVKYPGKYSIKEGETISSLIERAGGFTEEAFLEGSVFTRESIKKAQEKMRQRFIVRETRALLEEQQSVLLRRGSDVDIAQVAESVKMRSEMLDFIRSAEIEGRMVIRLTDIAELRGSNCDILLEDKDAIIVPQIPSSVAVIGSVNNPTSVPFEKNKSIEYYIHKTGGLTKHADKSGIYVMRANGEAVSKFMMSKKVERGDTVIIPQEFRYWTPPGQLLRDTVEILSRIIVGIGIIAALD